MTRSQQATSNGCKQPWWYWWWASWVWAGTRFARPAGQGRITHGREFPWHIKIGWIWPHTTVVRSVYLWFSCESDLPPRPQGKWILRCLSERTCKSRAWHRRTGSHMQMPVHQAHSDSCLACFTSQQLESQKNSTNFYEYHAAVNLHFFI